MGDETKIGKSNRSNGFLPLTKMHILWNLAFVMWVYVFVERDIYAAETQDLKPQIVGLSK